MMQSGNIETFNQLSQFTDISDFNNQIEQWMVELNSKFTKSEQVALKRLIRFSAKIAGVCNAKIGTVVSATHEKDGAGISRSTFKRMVAKAKEVGLLFVYETIRKNGSKSSNIYVFNRFITLDEASLKAEAEPSKDEKLNQPQTSNLSKTSNKYINKRKEDVDKSNQDKDSLDSTFVSEKVPMEFTSLVRCFFDDARQIEEYWKLVTISACKYSVTDNIIDTARKAFKALIRKMKFGNVNSTFGYFYGVLNRKFNAKYVRDLFNSCWSSKGEA